jgi:hypothetical protein
MDTRQISIAICLVWGAFILGRCSVRAPPVTSTTQDAHVQIRNAYQQGVSDTMQKQVVDRVRTTVKEKGKTITTVVEHINTEKENHESTQSNSSDIHAAASASSTRGEVQARRYLMLGVGKGDSTIYTVGGGLHLFPQVSVYGTIQADSELFSQWTHGTVSRWPAVTLGIAYHF